MKKIFTLLITGIMIFSVYGANVYASSDYEAELLSDLSIMQGDPDGNMRYNDKVSRAECAKIIVAVSKYRDFVDMENLHSAFKDVTAEHWAAPYVSVGVKNGLFKGYFDATFRPSNKVTYEEAITMLLRVLDYTEQDIGNNWPYDQIDMAKKLGIINGVNKSSGQELTRRDISKMVYNTLNSKSKGSQEKYLNNFNRTVGPITVTTSNWYKELGADTSARVLRDGIETTISAIMTNDVAYYMEEYNKILVYSKKVTGIYEDALPNKDTPVSVTVSGITYNIEGDDAYSKLSSGGDFNYGDTVTLLLGKSGDVAGVASKIAQSDKIIGFLSAVGVKDTVSSGTTVTRPYVRVILPTGEAREYITDKNYESYLNRVVTVKLDSGLAAISSASSKYDIYGKFVWDSQTHKLGSSTLSEDVKIIETSTTNTNETSTVASVYPQRLNGLNLSESDILYASKNSDGYIDNLILRDMTGDMHTYGIVTDAKNINTDEMLTGYYEYMVNGVKTVVTTQGKTFSVSDGQAVRIKSDGQKISSMTPLTLIKSNKITDVTGSSITLGGDTYTMSDKVQIYTKKSHPGVYSMITVEELKTLSPKHQAYVYADKAASMGGRVRIIVLNIG